jgi:hypothetical protein
MSPYALFPMTFAPLPHVFDADQRVACFEIQMSAAKKKPRTESRHFPVCRSQSAWLY